jgi:hypothetical protein
VSLPQIEVEIDSVGGIGDGIGKLGGKPVFVPKSCAGDKLSIQITNETKDFQATLFYNVMGRKIFAVGFEGYPDLYEMSRNVIDLHFSKKLGRYLLLRGSVEDVLNQSVVILQD